MESGTQFIFDYDFDLTLISPNTHTQCSYTKGKVVTQVPDINKLMGKKTESLIFHVVDEDECKYVIIESKQINE